MDDGSSDRIKKTGTGCRSKVSKKACPLLLRTAVAAAVLLAGLCTVLLELAGESWFVKWWLIRPAMASVGLIVNMGRLEYNLLTGDFSISDLEWSNSIYDGHMVAVEGGTKKLQGSIELAFSPWRVTVNNTRSAGGKLKLVVLSDAECRWAMGEDYVLPPLPPPCAAPEPPDFMWEMPQVLPERQPGEPMGKPWFVPDVVLKDLQVTDASLAVDWHHDYGSREYMRINDIALEVDECSPGIMGNMIFEASGGSFESDYVNLYSGALSGTARLTLGLDGYINVETWQSELNDFRSVVFGVEWPNSKLYAKGRSDGLNWYFDRIDGMSYLADGQGGFKLSGLITSWGFLVFPDSTIRCDREAVNHWFPQLAVDDIIWDIAISGGGEFEKPCFALDMNVANHQDLPHDFSCRTKFKIGTDMYNGTVWLRGFFLQASEEFTGKDGSREKVDFLQAAFTANEFTGYGYEINKFLNNNTLQISIKDFPAVGLNQLFNIPADSKVAFASGSVAGIASLELKKDFDLPGSLQCRITANDLTTDSEDILAEPANAAVEFDLTLAENDTWELENIQARLANSAGTVAEASGSGKYLPEEMSFKGSAGITSLVPSRLGIARREWMQKLLELTGNDDISLHTAAEITGTGVKIEELSINAAPFTAEMTPAEYKYSAPFPETFWHIQWQDWYPGNMQDSVDGDMTIKALETSAEWHGNISCGSWLASTAGSFDLRDLRLAMDGIQVSHPDFGNWQSGAFTAEFNSNTPVLTSPVHLTGAIEPSGLSGIMPVLTGVKGTLEGEATVESAGGNRYKVDININSGRESFTNDPAGNIVSVPVFRGVLESDIAGNFTASGTLEHSGAFELDSSWHAAGSFPEADMQIQINSINIPAVKIQGNDGRVNLSNRDGTVTIESDVPLLLQEKLTGRSRMEITGRKDSIDLHEFVFEISEDQNTPLLNISASGSSDRKGTDIAAEINFSLPELKDALKAGEKAESVQPPEQESVAATPDKHKAQESSGADVLQDVYLDFGGHPVDITLEFDRCEIIPDYILAGNVDIHTHEDTFDSSSRDLTLNGGRIEFQLKGNELAADNKNIDFELRLHDLLIGGGNENDNVIFCKYFLIFGQAPFATGYKLADNMAAWCTGSLGEIKIQNTIFDSFAGKALMTPLELLLRLRSALPDPSREMLGYEAIADDFTDLYAHTDTLKFDNADFEGKTQEGKFTLNKCIFSSKVHELRCPGSVCWGSRREIDFKASYCIGSLVIPVTIQGTVEEPEIIWSDAVWRVVSENIVEVGRDSLNILQNLNPWGGRKSLPGKYEISDPAAEK